MNEEAHKEEIKRLIKQKTEELSFAQYSGKIKGFVAFMIDNDGNLNLMEAYGNDTAFSIYVGCDLIKKRIVDNLINTSTPMPPME